MHTADTSSSNQAAGAATVQCPDCGAAVAIPADAAVGEVLLCANCAAELEIISLDPPLLDLFEEEEK